MVGFQGQDVGDDLRRYVAEGAPAGIIVFRRNISGTEQAAGLLRDLRSLWPEDALTPLMAVDQEGGKVRRLRPPECPEFLDLPQARDVAAGGDPGLTQYLGFICARQLAAVGFNVDFSPVLDVDSNPENPVIGPRSYGSSVDTVNTHAIAFTRGLQEGGVVPCGKHFPGHGDTDLDSHFALPSLPHGLERLRRIDAVQSGAFQHQEGAQALADKLMEGRSGQGTAQGSPRKDPFGRPMRGPLDTNDVSVPDEIDTQRAQRILKELRERAMELGRPQIELDYLDRLLKRF